MKFYESYLQSKNIKVVYVDAFNELSDVRNLIPYLKTNGVRTFEYTDTSDYWLEQRINKASRQLSIEKKKNPTPLFLNTTEEIAAYYSDEKRMFQTNFYKYQRQSRNIFWKQIKYLLGENGHLMMKTA